MSGNLSRRIAAAETKARTASGQRIVVVRRPDGLDAASLAAWKATEAKPMVKPDFTIVIRRLTAQWPPRNAAEVRFCLTSGLCADAVTLADKIRAMPPYPKQNAALLALAS